MQEGKEKRMELIDELRSTEALKPEEEKLNKEAKKAARAVQRKQRMMHHKVGYYFLLLRISASPAHLYPFRFFGLDSMIFYGSTFIYYPLIQSPNSGDQKFTQSKNQIIKQHVGILEYTHCPVR